jgi:hypothetical protein
MESKTGCSQLLSATNPVEWLVHVDVEVQTVLHLLGFRNAL